MEKKYSSKKPKVFYGYWIVAVAFLCLFIMSGSTFYAFSLFVKPLQADFGWSRGEIMTAFTIFCLVQGVTAPFIGRVVDQYGARKVIPTGALITGLGFVFLALMYNLWYFYAGWTVVGIGMAAMGPVPTTAVVSNWFQKKRGLAIGIMSAAVGAGGFALSPLFGGYLIPNFGWGTSYLVLALLTWVLIIPLALIVMKTKPSDIGLYPDGIENPESVAVTEALPSVSSGLTLRMALATSTFWLIAISFLSNGFSQLGITLSQVPHLEDIGFPVATAAAALGIVGLGSTIGKFGFGWLCDLIPAKYAFAIGLGLQLVGIILLINVEPTCPPATIWLYAIILGLGIGSWLPSMSILISTNFGLAAYGAIFGIITLVQSIGGATGPLMAGHMYDAMNTYHWAFIVFLALCAVSIFTILAVRRPKSLEIPKVNFK
jgi:MFS family permease